MAKVRATVEGTVVEGGAVKDEELQGGYGATAGPAAGAHHNDTSGFVQGVPLYDDTDKGSDGDPEVQQNLGKFVSQGYQDVWAAVLFIISVVATVYFGVANFQDNLTYIHTHKASMATKRAANGKTKHKLQVDTVPDDGTGVSAQTVLLGALGVTMVAVCSSILVLCLLHKYPKKAIIGANVGVAIMYLFLALWMFSHGSIWGGLLCLIVAPLQLLWLHLVRSRIAFATAILKISTKLVMRYKSTVLCSILSVLAFYAYAVLNLSMSFPMLHRLGERQADGGDAALYLLCTLFFFWVAQVCINVVHVTVAGLVATWYFVGDEHMPPNPTLASFKRATTTSFGSICFGSLLVAIVQTMRRACQMFRDHENDFVRCIVDCLLSILEAMLEYFNTYAYVHVAIYGVGYIDAAKRTWALAKECGWKAYFNDCLIEPTITLTSLGMAVFMGGVTYLISGGNAALGVTTFVAVLAVCLTVLRCVESAVPTIFVCFAEIPSALQGTNAELWNLLRADGNEVV